MKPKKLIRNGIISKLKVDEFEFIEDINELNQLYILKVKEELQEIINSDFLDIMEFVDLIQVAFQFSRVNNFTHEQISLALIEKTIEKGSFSNIVLNNLNPSNTSNNIYFDDNISIAKGRFKELLDKEYRLSQLDK